MQTSLDTEAFLEPEKGGSRGDYAPMTDLLLAFVAYMAKKREESPAISINRIRYSVLTRCVARAMEPPGIYTDGVPYPVEYKSGRRRRGHHEELQLCAQAVCL